MIQYDMPFIMFKADKELSVTVLRFAHKEWRHILEPWAVYNVFESDPVNALLYTRNELQDTPTQNMHQSNNFPIFIF